MTGRGAGRARPPVPAGGSGQRAGLQRPLRGRRRRDRAWVRTGTGHRSAPRPRTGARRRHSALRLDTAPGPRSAPGPGSGSAARPPAGSRRFWERWQVQERGEETPCPHRPARGEEAEEDLCSTLPSGAAKPGQLRVAKRVTPSCCLPGPSPIPSPAPPPSLLSPANASGWRLHARSLHWYPMRGAELWALPFPVGQR
ncbi:adropin isoform X1 [Patagioenas fasciata]|uniref:adropin isoform X1 n=1 Tax=Patagioenas fasciata TaxID=372321 RepID=UPI003A9A510B